MGCINVSCIQLLGRIYIWWIDAQTHSFSILYSSTLYVKNKTLAQVYACSSAHNPLPFHDSTLFINTQDKFNLLYFNFSSSQNSHIMIPLLWPLPFISVLLQMLFPLLMYINYLKIFSLWPYLHLFRMLKGLCHPLVYQYTCPG